MNNELSLLWQEGRKYIINHDYHQALYFLAEAYKKTPCLDLAIDYCKCLIRLKKFHQAQDLISFYSYDFPNHQGVKTIQAHLSYLEQNYQKALELYKELIGLNPQEPAFWVSAAQCAAQLSNFDLAYTYFEKSEDRLSILGASWLRNYGIVALKTKNIAKASKLFQTLIESYQRDCDAEVFFHYALCWHLNACSQKAIEYYEQALCLDNQHIPSLYNVALLYHQAQEKKRVIAYCQRILEIEPQHILAKTLLQGYAEKETIKTLDRNFVEALFDQYSYSYDSHMKETLKNQSCLEARHIIAPYLQKITNAVVLDLGCGTGEMGLMMRDGAMTLMGIDCSEGMLAQAKKKNIYDKLLCQDIRDVEAYPDGLFDIITAIEVSNYLGFDCEKLIKSLWARLNQGGLILFTAEKDLRNNPELCSFNNELRFSFKKEFFQDISQHLEGVKLMIEEKPLRLHHGEEKIGYYVCFLKEAKTA